MFQSFYLSRRWLPWAFPGSAVILFATWYKVELDVRINEWFGGFYNLIQKTLGQPNGITMDEYLGQLASFGYIACLYVTVAVFTDFFVFFHYMYFDVVRYAYLQFGVLVPISPSGLPWLRGSSLSVSCSRSFVPSAGWKARSNIS